MVFTAMKYIRKLRLLLERQTKRRLVFLMFFSVFVSVIETIGISAIMPFIDIATNFDSIQTNQYYHSVFEFFGFTNNIDFAIAFGMVLIAFYIFRGVVNLIYSYFLSNFSEGLYAKIVKKLFKTYLAMPYQIFTNKNSSHLTKAITAEASLMAIVVNAVLLMVSEVFVVLFLYTLMLFASWKITLVFTVIFAFKIIFLMQTVSKKAKKIGAEREQSQAQFYEIVNRVFGNFEHIKLQDYQRLKETKNAFAVAVDRYSNANASYRFFDFLPRMFLETGGFSLVVLLLVILLYLGQSNVAHILPILSLFVLALYRLLPSINRIVIGYNTLIYNHKSIDIIAEELSVKKENLGNKNIEFKQKIQLQDISFYYQDKPILKHINLTINSGEKIAFVGESGSGKSTLVNLIIGLLQAVEGKIIVDDSVIDASNLQSWRAQIGYIPQQVYLFDGTVADNICFGRKLDEKLLQKVLKQANIFEFFHKKQGILTLVGEGGIHLSGGQKQRVAIARALYAEPKILLLDEATSALDGDTEQKIMNEIYKISKDKTLIIIAHRLSTIKDCDKIYKITDSGIEQQ
ncbi:MAG: ABC transporter ATP-binding protein [Candidatus Thioglobus sp.]|nr:MAG: ABC transporter ATP-binding protein [Candidatus Thioglobus sp.]KAA0447154.1 MAG: ABC transporter ATP-binding protein [Candidatus Thioglobus sp.]